MTEFIFAGFGGQGMLLIGQIIAKACMADGKNVSWLPSYGPEMRGGTANCSVVISEKAIGSPIVERPSSLIAMNYPSMEKFEPMVKSGGSIFINSSLITENPKRNDVEIFNIDSAKLAAEAGSIKTANMVMLGALLEKTKIVSLEYIEKCIHDMMKNGKEKLAIINLKAIELGRKAVL